MEACGVVQNCSCCHVERCFRSGHATNDAPLVGDFGSIRKQKPPLCGLHSQTCHRIRRILVEVFSIQFLGYKEKDFRWIFGTILLKTPTIPYTLSLRRIDHPQIIDQDGFVRLTGPECGIEANDDISFIPFLFHVAFAVFHGPPRHDIWRADMEGNDMLYDQLKLHKFENTFCTMEMNYAIYRDGAEVHLDVTVIDWEGETVEVYGTVSVQNSRITDPKARSLLLNNTSEEAISVHPGNVTQLPLFRKVTVLPLESVLVVDLCLLHHGTIFAQGTVRFTARVTGVEERILVCNPGKIKVKATWLNDHVHMEFGQY